MAQNGPTKAQLQAQLNALLAQQGGGGMPQQNYSPGAPYPSRAPLAPRRMHPVSKSGAQYETIQISPPKTRFRDRPAGQQLLAVQKFNAQQRQAQGKKLSQSQMRLLSDNTIQARPPLSDQERVGLGLPTRAQARQARQMKKPNSTMHRKPFAIGGGNRGGGNRGVSGPKAVYTWHYTLPNGQQGTVQGGASAFFVVNKIIGMHKAMFPVVNKATQQQIIATMRRA